MNAPISRRAVLAAGLLLATLATACTSEETAEVRVVAVTAVTDRQARPVLGERGLDAVRRAAESDRGTFTLVVAGAPELTRTVDLVARRDRGGVTEVEHGPRRAGLIDGLVATAADAVASAAPTAGRPDLLGALAEAARGVPGTLLVLDSGITTTDPLDLRRLGWDGDPVAVIARLASADLLPDLRGWDVVLVGLGRVSGGQAAPGTAQQRWLERFWTTVCTAAGARSCTVEPVLDAAAAPLPGVRSTAVVDVAAVATEDLPGGAVAATIPDSRLGFAPGSADLAPDAGEALAPVLDAYRRAPGAVRVEGFVAFWGDEGSRAALSQARADGVARLLVSLGVAPGDVSATGRGAADGPDASTTNGAFDEEKVVANGIRRVVVTVRPRT